MWDELSMRGALASVGFTEIRRAKFGDNPNSVFSKVERLGRFIDEGAYGGDECAMEARRPEPD
jgi:hypothetical protein